MTNLIDTQIDEIFKILKTVNERRGQQYAMGYDCGKNGPTETNCHFALFNTRAMTQEWERGKKAGEAQRKAEKTDAIRLANLERQSGC